MTLHNNQLSFYELNEANIDETFKLHTISLIDHKNISNSNRPRHFTFLKSSPEYYSKTSIYGICIVITNNQSNSVINEIIITSEDLCLKLKAVNVTPLTSSQITGIQPSFDYIQQEGITYVMLQSQNGSILYYHLNKEHQEFEEKIIISKPGAFSKYYEIESDSKIYSLIN